MLKNVAAELESFNEEAAKARSQPKVSFGDMIKDQYRWPLFIAVMLMFSQQLTGINAAMYAYLNIIYWPVLAICHISHYGIRYIR